MTDASVVALVSPHASAITTIAAEHGATVSGIVYGGGMSRAERNNHHVARITVKLQGHEWSTKHVYRVGNPDARRELKSAIKNHLLAAGCGRVSVHLLAE